MVEARVTSAVELKASILNHLLGIFYHLLKKSRILEKHNTSTAEAIVTNIFNVNVESLIALKV